MNDNLLLHTLLRITVEQKGSDLHIFSDGTAKMRLNGKLVRLNFKEALTPENINKMILFSVPENLRKTLEDEYEIDYLYKMGEERFRVNAFKAQSNLEAVFRVIKSQAVDLKELAIPNVVTDLTQTHSGLILVVGATGSGKTTTLAGMIDKINRTYAKVIITIENPVEFLHKSIQSSISQREIGIDTKNFGSALRSALRQDPDVIVVGEIRDSETAKIALEAAQTGHLVLATMHASDTTDSINRFINLFPDTQKDMARLMLADTLKAVIGQRLLKKINGERVPAVEVLIKNLRVEEIIKGVDESSLLDAINSGGIDGMQSFDGNLLELVRSRVITVDVAKSFATNQAMLLRDLKSHRLI